MKKQYLLAFVFWMCLWWSWGVAQSWTSLDRLNKSGNIVWYDSLEDRVLVAGPFMWYDSTEIHGFGYIDGDSIIGLGCGFQVPCGIQLPNYAGGRRVGAFVRYDGELYVTGAFEMAGGQIVNGIAKWQGNDWVPVGPGLKIAPDGTSGVGYRLKNLNGELYVCGTFDSINGIPANGLAKYNGGEWLPVHGLPRFHPNASNSIADVCEFQGELYIGGNITNQNNSNISDIAKWNGTEWVAVGNGLTGSFNEVTRLLEYHGKLIIAGHFNKYQNPGSIPGNGITAWDGMNWDTLRGGIAYRLPGGSVSDIAIHNDELYVVGGFDSVGGMPCNNIAKWDGERWCGYSDANDFFLRSITFQADTMYVALEYGALGPDSIRTLARWSGPFLGDSCQMVGVSEPIGPVQSVHLYPNPASGSFSLMMDGGEQVISLRLVDVAGREVIGERRYVTGQVVDVSMLPAGVYVVEVHPSTGSGTVRGQVEYIKLIKR